MITGSSDGAGASSANATMSFIRLRDSSDTYPGRSYQYGTTVCHKRITFPQYIDVGSVLKTSLIAKRLLLVVEME